MSHKENKRDIASLEVRGIVKKFPGVLANDHIDFDVHAGEIHALLGENGAGKSTLMRILYGMYKPDEGEIKINGESLQLRSPVDAIHRGIGMVHQHFMLVPSFTVAENVTLGLPSSRRFLLDLDIVSQRIETLARTYGLRVNPQAKVSQLSVGEQQQVEILKALYRGASLLIMDEPTAVLTPQEVDDLFRTLRRMAEEGHSLIFISHKLHEILSLSDRVTVLRDGKVMKTLPTNEATEAELARLMVGRTVLLRIERPPAQCGGVRLALEGVCAQKDDGTPALKQVNLNVHAGEILGVAGVSGNGQRELAEVVAGLRLSTKGKVYLDDVDVTGWSPGELLKHGLSYIPEDRMHEATVRDFTVEENLILKDHAHSPYANGIFMNFREIARNADQLIHEYNIRTTSRTTPLRALSGGNIQKLVIARELSRNPSVLIAAQPTRGVDISTTAYIRRRLIEQRERGIATLLFSEDLDEILLLSDRIAVIYGGQIMGVLKPDDVSVEKLGLMMTGARS